MTAPDPESSRLLSLVVHELRTPLTVVSGYLRILVRGRAGPLSDQQQKLLEDAERACSKLNDLISELGDVAKLEARSAVFNRGDVSPGPVLEALARPAGLGREAAVTVELPAAVQDIRLFGDAGRLATAFRAITSYMVREAVSTGRVIVEARVDDSAAGRTLVVLFGHPETIDDLRRRDPARLDVFDEWRSGNGLGLVVARRVLEAHGGHVWSRPGPDRHGVVVHLPVRARGDSA
jgi:signal transduction histidine kinase